MEPHPEGGWFVRTWTAVAQVDTPGGTRPAATLIHFLLPAGDVSAWHRVTSDEVWLWHGPGVLPFQLGGGGDLPEAGDEPTHVLGPAEGQTHQLLVSAGTWQRTLPAQTDVLVSCLVSPGFDYADWTLLPG
jgi:uncharacterized protein